MNSPAGPYYKKKIAILVKTRNVHVGEAQYLEKETGTWENPDWLEASSYDSSCLVPYFDMLNNDPRVCNNYSYNRRLGQFEITCRNSISHNEQVFINYGSYGTLDILLGNRAEHYRIKVRT